MSDSPLPIPSGYICHTSYAVGKGRQPQQHDCPSSHPPYTATPISPPRANIYWSPSKASFCILFYLSLYLSIPLLLNRSASFPLSLSHFLPSTTSARSFAANLFSVFFLCLLSHVPPYFSRKRETQDGFRSRRAVKTLAAVLRDTSCTLVQREGRGATRWKFTPRLFYSWKRVPPAVVRECHAAYTEIRRNPRG